MKLRLHFARKYGAFREPQVRHFPATLSLAPAEISPSLLEHARVSKNLAFSVKPPGVRQEKVLLTLPETRAADIEQPHRVQVYQNLLKPIGMPDAKGKNYTDPELQADLYEGCEEPKVFAAINRPRKAYTERRLADGGIRRQTAGLWDIILPLLKPPLDFNFPAQLDIPWELYPFQMVGVKRLISSESFLLGDEMGTGKTVMATVALRILFQKGMVRKTLVVSPVGVLPVWDRHLADWGGPHLVCTTVNGPKKVREKDWKYQAHVYVVSYDTLRNDVLGDFALLDEERLREFDLVILDEAHYIRNAASGRSRAVAFLAPKYRWALSGTPMQNSLDDLKAVFAFVKPGILPSESPCSPSQASNLIRPFFLRRMKRMS